MSSRQLRRLNRKQYGIRRENRFMRACQTMCSSITFLLNTRLKCSLMSVFPSSNKMSVSRVSKSNLFALFRTLCQQCGRSDLLSLPSYSQAKMSALSFQLAKQQFFQALGAQGYGAWIGKPLEEKSFEAGEGTGNNSTSVSVGCSGSRSNGYKQEKV